jgi:hypothetical protein
MDGLQQKLDRIETKITRLCWLVAGCLVSAANCVLWYLGPSLWGAWITAGVSFGFTIAALSILARYFERGRDV